MSKINNKLFFLDNNLNIRNLIHHSNFAAITNKKRMQHLILTNTSLFRIIQQRETVSSLESAYDEFVETVFSVCSDINDIKAMVITMTYTEIELQHLLERNSSQEEHNEYIRKMISLIRKTIERIRHYHNLQSLSIPIISEDVSVPSVIRHKWTGSVIELVEMVYGLVEMGVIDSGDKPIHELVAHIAVFFNVEIKDCYSTYVDMKRRKNESRTYFLDKMRERLNSRMQRDDEKEKMRR